MGGFGMPPAKWLLDFLKNQIQKGLTADELRQFLQAWPFADQARKWLQKHPQNAQNLMSDFPKFSGVISSFVGDTNSWPAIPTASPTKDPSLAPQLPPNGGITTSALLGSPTTSSWSLARGPSVQLTTGTGIGYPPVGTGDREPTVSDSLTRLISPGGQTGPPGEASVSTSAFATISVASTPVAPVGANNQHSNVLAQVIVPIVLAACLVLGVVAYFRIKRKRRGVSERRSLWQRILGARVARNGSRNLVPTEESEWDSHLGHGPTNVEASASDTYAVLSREGGIHRPNNELVDMKERIQALEAAVVFQPVRRDDQFEEAEWRSQDSGYGWGIGKQEGVVPSEHTKAIEGMTAEQCDAPPVYTKH